MSTRDRILAIDVGTQGSRAVLHDRQGNEHGFGRRKHAPFLRPAVGAVLQDPDDIWGAVVHSVRTVMAEHDAARIAAIALTSQRSAVIPVDTEGRALHPIVSWLDARSASEIALLEGIPQKLLSWIPERNMVRRIAGWSRPNILAEAAPEAFAAAHKWLTISGWLSHRFTGRYVDAAGSIAGVWPFDPKSANWMPSPLPHKLLGFRPGTLPELVSAGDRLGLLTREAADTLGLEQGVPVIAVGGDKQAEALGGGVVSDDPQLGGVSLGTGAAVYLAERRFHRSPLFHYLTNCAAEPGRWVNEYMVMRGFWMVSWFVRELAAEECRLAEERGTSPEAILSERALEEVPAGSSGLILLPRFTAAPDAPGELGALIGLGEQHGRLAIFRAILEGIAFDLRRGLALLESATGRRITSLRAGGGGTHSRLALEATAAIIGRPLELGATRELSALGASICAAAGLGWYPSWAEAAAAMTRVKSRVEPDPKLQRIYDPIYENAFSKAFARVRPITRWLAQHRA